MAAINKQPNVIAIGAGPSGIALAYAMKVGLGFDNFMVSLAPWKSVTVLINFGSEDL